MALRREDMMMTNTAIATIQRALDSATSEHELRAAIKCALSAEPKRSAHRILPPADLKSTKGITYSRCQLWRLEKEGKFPKRIRLNDSDRGSPRYGYIEAEIDAWIEAKMRERVGADVVAKV